MQPPVFFPRYSRDIHHPLRGFLPRTHKHCPPPTVYFIFSALLSFHLAPPPTPSLSNHDETQPLTLGLLRIINFSHT